MSYQTIIKQEFAVRLERNPNYSLRAFARDLGVAPSTLSEVMNGKSGLSRRSAERIAAALHYTPEETAHFCQLVDQQSTRWLVRRQLAEAPARSAATSRPAEQHLVTTLPSMTLTVASGDLPRLVAMLAEVGRQFETGSPSRKTAGEQLRLSLKVQPAFA